MLSANVAGPEVSLISVSDAVENFPGLEIVVGSAKSAGECYSSEQRVLHFRFRSYVLRRLFKYIRFDLLNFPCVVESSCWLLAHEAGLALYKVFQ